MNKIIALILISALASGCITSGTDPIAIDTPQEREAILGYITQVGAAEADVLALLTWLYNACRDALAAPGPAREFGIRPLWSESRKEFKCSGACVEADSTVVMGVYGNDNPRNRCEIWHNGRKVFPASGFYDAETLFPYPGGRIVAERGFMLQRDGGTYRQTKCKAKWVEFVERRINVAL